MEGNSEHKVSITLSYEAYRTINSDMQIFQLKENWAGFINKVLENHKTDSAASIALASRKERDRLVSILCPDNSDLSPSRAEIVDKLVSDYKNHLHTEMHSFPSDSAKTTKTRLNNKNFDDILNDRSDYYDESDYPYAGLYVKAILEDYARQDFPKRENIFFKDIKNSIDRSIENKTLIKIKYNDRFGNLKTWKIKPYEIIESKENHYNYLVGLPYDPQAKESRLYSLRLSRIKEASPMSQHATISQKERNEIENQIKKKGVQYIQGDSEICRVELTEAGVKLFRSILHLRPEAINIMQENNGRTIYDFDCTNEQIRNYFFQFGKEARIIFPSTLAEEFFKKYKEAYEHYQ